MTTSIQYYPNLIQNLSNDHRKLTRQINMLNHLANNGKYKLITSMLNYFRRSLLAHMHEEEVKLYIYLQNKLPKSSNEYAQMRSIRKEMNNILARVVNFLETYQSVRRTKLLQKTFSSDLGKITELFTKRVTLEEKFLYVMYQKYDLRFA